MAAAGETAAEGRLKLYGKLEGGSRDMPPDLLAAWARSPEGAERIRWAVEEAEEIFCGPGLKAGLNRLIIIEQDIYFLCKERNMGAYKTKYFGDLEVDELNDEILVETHIENNGEDVPVSIIIRNFSENADKMDEITAVLDCYFAMHEAAKAYIEKHYPEHEGIVNYLFRYAGDVLKKEYRSKRGKVFTLDLESMIRRLDPPSVSLPHYKDGKIRAEITYYCPDVDNGQLSISIDKDCKIYHSEFNDYR